MIGNAPFGWVERDGQTTGGMKSYGLGLDVFDKIAKELNLTYTNTAYTSNEEAMNALSKGEIDLFLGVYHRSYGSVVEIVTPAYFKNVFMIYFKKGKELPVESYLTVIHDGES